MVPRDQRHRSLDNVEAVDEEAVLRAQTPIRGEQAFDAKHSVTDGVIPADGFSRFSALRPTRLTRG